MARGRGGIRYYVDADTTGLERALGRADRSIAGIGGRLASGALRTGAFAAAGALTALGLAAADGVRSLARIETINAQTAAGIKSTGGVANVTAREIVALGSSIEALTGVEQESIQEGQNLLVTFCMEETAEALTLDRGWVRHDQLGAGDWILGYDPEDDSVKWEQVESVHRFAVNGDLIRWRSKQIDVATTPHHRWWTVERDERLRYTPQFRTTEEISGHNIAVMIGGGTPACFAEEATYSDELVELLGWVLTEGWADWLRPSTPHQNGCGFSQSETANPEKVARIRDLIGRLRRQGHEVSESRQERGWGKHSGVAVALTKSTRQVAWKFGKSLGKTIKQMAPEKKLRPRLLSRLTDDQAALLLDTLIAGDGHVDRAGHRQYIQKDEEQLGVVAMLCAMLGIRTSTLGRGDALYLCQTNRLLGHNANAEPERYEGIVWCPHLRTGIFMARCNGRTFWTGNTRIRNEVGQGNDVFNRATRAAVDFSVRMKTDVTSASLLVGKALNDPVKGVTALTRAGVQFTAQQREQIKELAESGRLLEAQKIVLAELNTQFAGSAEAFGETTTGKVRRFRHALGTLQESIVMGALPAMERLTDYAVREVAPKVNRAAAEIEKAWQNPNLTPEQRFAAAWDSIERTGFPEAAKQAIYTGLREVAVQGPQILIRGLAEAPWPAKGLIAAIILAKIGPALRLVGGGLGGALGAGGSGGIAAGIGRAGPVPVVVTNPGFARAGAGGAGAGGAAAPLTRAGNARLALRGAGALGLVVGGGMLANEIVDRTGLPGLPSEDESRRYADRVISAQIEGFRRGGPELRAEIEKYGVGRILGGARQTAEITSAASDAMAEFSDAIARRGPRVTRSMQTVVSGAVDIVARMPAATRKFGADAIVRMTAEMESRGRASRGTTESLVDAIEAQFGRLPSATRRAAQSAMPWLEALNRSLSLVRGASETTAEAVEDFADRAAAAAARASRSAPGRASGALRGLAGGGLLPGTYRGVDELLMPVAPGEAILTPRQQQMVGVERVMAAIRATGGRIGGDGFALGGVAGGAWQAASSFARRQVGEPYVWGGGHSFGDHAGWDCSGFASNVAARVPGYTGGIGTTMTLYPRSRPARGTEPVVFGFSGMETRDPRRQHMGIRVGGVWYDAGSGGVETGRTRWPSGLRIPPGLEGLSENAAGGPDPGPGGAPDRPAPLFSRAVQALISRATGAATTGVSDSLAGAGLTGAQQRGVESAGRRAAISSLAAALSPDAIADARTEAERRAEERALGRNLDRVQGAIAKLRERKGRLVGELSRLARDRKATNKRAKARRLRAAIRVVTTEIRELIGMAAEVNARLEEIGLSRALEDYGEEYDAGQAGGGAGGAPEGPEAPAGPTADQQAALDQANARAESARQETAAFGAFIAALRGSGDIDPRSGTTVINVAGSLVQESQVASWIVDALGRASSRSVSVVRSAA